MNRIEQTDRVSFFNNVKEIIKNDYKVYSEKSHYVLVKPINKNIGCYELEVNVAYNKLSIIIYPNNCISTSELLDKIRSSKIGCEDDKRNSKPEHDRQRVKIVVEFDSFENAHTYVKKMLDKVSDILCE